MEKTTGLELYEADLLFNPVTLCNLKPIRTVIPHPEQVLVQRDSNFKIALEMKGTAKTPQELIATRDVALGTVSDSEDSEGTEEYSNRHIIMTGVSPDTRNSNPFTGQFTISGSATSITKTYVEKTQPKSSILYLLGHLEFCFSRGTSRIAEGKTTLSRQNCPEIGAAQTVSIGSSGDFHSASSDCFLIKNRFGTVLFSKGAGRTEFKHLSPCYLHFVEGPGVVNHDFRRTFLEAFSFAVGKRLIEVGYTELDEKNEILKRSSRSPYSSNIHTEATIHELPPAPTRFDGTFMVDEEAISSIVELFLNSQEKYGLSDVMWNLWTARMMPLGLELVAYTAALESLIKSWFKVNSEGPSGFYVPQKSFEELTSKFFEALEPIIPKEPNWPRVLSKMKNANSISISDQNKAFFEKLGIATGKVEKEVMAARHKFAHGGTIDAKEIKRLVVIARSFESLLNRSILKAIGFSGQYYDYSTLHFPLRDLSRPLGGPNNDGHI